MLTYWIWLSTRENIGARTIRLLLEHFGTPEQVWLADAEAYRAIEGLRSASSLEDKDLTAAEKIISDCYRRNIHILTYQDASYPERLRNIDDPPMVLYYEGNFPNFDAIPVIAVVGTRKASLYGLLQAKSISYQLSKMGATVVSGGADGIDTLALKGALGGGSPVAAVLGCGVDVCYPKVNKGLFEDVRRYGCLISEYPPGTPANAYHFPVRNRILSGLSLGVLVVEAPKKSGALITANRALEQGRDVFTLPSNVGITSSAGNIELLKQGAIVAAEGWDILKEYVHLFPELSKKSVKTIPMMLSEPEKLFAEQSEPEKLLAQEKQIPEGDDKKTVDKPQTSAYIDLQDVREKLNGNELTVAECLQDGELHVDQIVEQSGLPTAGVLAALTMLELKGYVRSLPAKRFSLAEKK